MLENLSQIIGFGFGLLIAVPIGIHMFRECFRNTQQFGKELKEARGSEERKLLNGEFTKAVNHQFIEFKAGFSLVFPVLIFFLTYVITSAISETAIKLYQAP